MRFLYQFRPWGSLERRQRTKGCRKAIDKATTPFWFNVNSIRFNFSNQSSPYTQQELRKGNQPDWWRRCVRRGSHRRAIWWSGCRGTTFRRQIDRAPSPYQLGQQRPRSASAVVLLCEPSLSLFWRLSTRFYCRNRCLAWSFVPSICVNHLHFCLSCIT